jgi:DNA-directed RNA polymerase specialized sigma24 family protein
MAIETLGAALRQINRLFAEGVVAGLSDAQLVERFLAHGDAGAFESLVGRHGPMVLSVCRGILHDPHDAEDAFLATFLVLVTKGGTIRGLDALGGWLHQVAHRVAIQANTAAARRRSRERQVGQMAAATSTNGPAASDDLLPALHEEIARLPVKLASAALITVGATAWAASAAMGIGNGAQNAVAQVMLPGSTPLVHRSPIQAGQEPVAQVMLPGSTAIDPTHLARVRARFVPARVVQLAQLRQLATKTGQVEFRELRPGDSVSKGDLLAVLYSADVASKKNDLLDALVQLERDQYILDEGKKHEEAPSVFMLIAERAAQGDRDAVNRVINTLKLWDIPQDEIDTLHAEARRICADKNGWFQRPDGRWAKLGQAKSGGQGWSRPEQGE